MLDLNDLTTGQPGLTPAAGAAMSQCAGVCLENQGFVAGETTLEVEGYIEATHVLEWPVVTEQALRTWADLREATEIGAEGIAISLVYQELGYATIERAALGTRIDRWLGYESDTPYFQRKARLETSGILHDIDGEVNRRLNARLERLESADSNLPAYVIIVEFSRPLAKVGAYERF